LGSNATFSSISAISWRPVFSGGGSRSTLGKQLLNFITKRKKKKKQKIKNTLTDFPLVCDDTEIGYV
jgi:hypothetical protein